MKPLIITNSFVQGSAIALLLLLAISRQGLAQTPLGTDFTFQGNLSSPGMPALSTADFQFTMHDAADGGAQIGAMIPKDNVALVNGVFTLSLDFGASPLAGQARWLQISLRSPSGAGGFTTLAPRQPITAVPYATFSTQTRGMTVDASGRVGIGTSTPGVIGSKLDVIGGHVAVSNSRGFLSLNATGNNIGAGIDTTSTDELQLVADGIERARIKSNGNMGVGTTSPAAGFHVRKEPETTGGTLALEGTSHTFLSFFPNTSNASRKGYLGFASAGTPDLTIATEANNGKIVMSDASGVHFPTGGKENLRIIRGFVIGDGTVDYGTGFTVNRIEEGRYVINFDTPFSAFPVATANTVSVGFSSCFIEFSGIGPASIGLHVVRRSDGDLVDGHFYFIAIGPR